jgi:hypothetical protein
MKMGEKLVIRCRGSMVSAVQYNRYVVNEKLFHTIAYDVGKKSQNNGVCVLIVDGETYYGKLTQIIEVEYYDLIKYILFKCDWADNTIEVRSGAFVQISNYWRKVSLEKKELFYDALMVSVI